MKPKSCLLKKLVFSFVYIFFFLFCSSYVSAEIRINEIYPAPKTEEEEEWVELYNNGTNDIDLTEYTLQDATQKPIKIESMNIAAGGFVIATAHKTLNNSNGDTVSLKKNLLEDPIDIATYSGTFDEFKSYVKCPDGWIMSTIITQNESNDKACPTVTPTPTSTPTPTPTTIPISYDNILISEVMPDPLEENEKEWVELYNHNDFTVSLDNWYIDDEENAGSAPKVFSAAINTKSYFIFEVSSYFNNDGDSVRLLDFAMTKKDSFSYSKSEKGKTYGRQSFTSADFCLQNPSKGTLNNACISQAASPSPTPTPSLPPTPLPTFINLPSPTPTPLDEINATPSSLFTLPLIIVDNAPSPTADEEITGSVLAARSDRPIHSEPPDPLALARGLSVSSALISLVNIGNIVRKIIQSLT